MLLFTNCVYMEYKANMTKTPFLLRQSEAIMEIAAGIGLIDTMKKEEFLRKLLNKEELPIYHYPGARVYAIKIRENDINTVV